MYRMLKHYESPFVPAEVDCHRAVADVRHRSFARVLTRVLKLLADDSLRTAEPMLYAFQLGGRPDCANRSPVQKAA